MTHWIAFALFCSAHGWRTTEVHDEHHHAAPEALLEQERSDFPVARHLAHLAPALPTADVTGRQPLMTQHDIARRGGVVLRESGGLFGERSGKSGDEDAPMDATSDSRAQPSGSSSSGGQAASGESSRAKVFEAWKERISQWLQMPRGTERKVEVKTEVALEERPRHNDWLSKSAADFLGRFVRLKLPQDWSPLLSASDLHLVHNGKRSRVYVGTCVYDEDCRVAIKVMDSKDVETHNEIRMMKLLRLSGNVVTYLASEEFSDSTYMLMPAADGTLAKYISGLGKAGRREMPLDDSLPILIDLLRGIRDLNEMHVVHCALTEEKVLLKDGRALISDFRSATIVDDSEKSFGHNTVGPYELPFVPRIPMNRLPPETIRGIPTGPSNNVYQVGAIFSLMCLGHVPMLRGLAFYEPDIDELPDWDPRVDESIQNHIRTNFSLQNDAGFKALEDKDNKELLAGMLEMDLEKRWGILGALNQAIAIAEKRGIRVPPERQPMNFFPVLWKSDWE